ncbi:low temperature requirement protein A [Plantactinospora soyae]|uniref:Low temperature requirement protein LtrA n=1 Tax=Plantactinospora soyae TaxID=1544732 RepID=A0A927MIU0_9ACTN|nr:low temperature requirement protein A [Plantactinospora soyae]MBE1492398.1 low temperature requirement protein LtrA [Plantactinospora soyae]
MADTRLERLLRKPGRPREISFLELFFDLVIIFALTQLSGRFLHNFGWEDTVQTLILLAAIWSLWVAAAHLTDWFNPDEPYVRALTVVSMFAVLLVAAAVPNAFGKHGFVFAGVYVAINLGRQLANIWMLRGHPLQEQMVRTAVWFGVTAVPWLVGAFLPATPRLVCWSVAVLLEQVSIALGRPVPGLREAGVEHLRLVGDHIAERYRQIFIISLGVLILDSGISLSTTRLDIVRLLAFAIAFANAVLLLWSWFLPRGLDLANTIDQQPRRALRTAHIQVVGLAGIVVTAMGDQILIAHPLGETRAVWSAGILAGPFLFLAGRAIYAWIIFHRPAWRAPVGMLVIAGISPGLLMLPPLAVAVVANLVLLAVVLSYRYIRLGPRRAASGSRLEGLLRKRERPREISFHELFFDLAMIFALSRLSQRVLNDYGLVNLAETLVLFCAVWWVWVATAWSTDWFNPEEPYLQRLIIGIMFAGLLMAAAVPNAFGEHGLLFACAYAAIHLGRGLAIVPVLRGHPLQARSARVLIWFSISAVLWVVGALLPPLPQLALWAVAVAVDGASAWFGWPVPRLTRPQAHLRVIGEHIAERYRQVYIIALGELVLVSGLTYSGTGFDSIRTLAFTIAFANAVLMLWSYFLPRGRDLGTVVNTTAPRIAVAASYCHGLMVAAAVVTAVGAEMLIRRPLGETRVAWIMVIIAGVVLHIIARTVYGVVMFEARRPWRGPVALCVIAAITPGLLAAPLLVVAGALNVVLLCLVLSYRSAKVDPPAAVST